MINLGKVPFNSEYYIIEANFNTIFGFNIVKRYSYQNKFGYAIKAYDVYSYRKEYNINDLDNFIDNGVLDRTDGSVTGSIGGSFIVNSKKVSEKEYYKYFNKKNPNILKKMYRYFKNL